MTTSIAFKSAAEIVRLIRSREVSPLEVMGETLNRIRDVNPPLNAFVSLRSDEALEEARAMTEGLAAGKDPGVLGGIPIGVKDLEDVKDMVTSFGSIPFKDHRVETDSTQVARLKRAGAIVVGKTNTPEFGYTGFTKNLLHGVTANPWNRERTPGGSSGGSAAAVASGMVPLATGSDAGGSIRIPSSYSGCFGLKTSFGRIPLGPAPFLQMYHVLTLGPITWDVEDAALYLDCTAGYHPSDPASLPRVEGGYAEKLKHTPEKLRIAFSPTLGFAKVQREVRARVEDSVRAFEEIGHTVELWEGSIPDVSDVWAKLMDGELYGLLHRSLDRHGREMGKTLVHALEKIKSFALPDLVEAHKTRTHLNQVLWELFERYDLLLTPTTPTEAFGAKGPPPTEIEGEPIPLLWAVAFTYPFNLSGHPAASVPAGLTKSGLPVGLQIIGPHHRDDLVLQMAWAYEQVRPWKDLRPPGYESSMVGADGANIMLK
jgi:aspartyl-tRNA(Asn)/glutamyl-tRNA(Gln) amidotransferase subunit A